MAAIKQLAGQTLWYGVSNIGARLLNYALTPLLTHLMDDPSGLKDYGNYSLIYSWIAVMNIIFTYGFETGFFRFSNKPGTNRRDLFDSTFGSLIISTIGLVVVLAFFRVPINNFLALGHQPRYIVWCLLLIAFDTLSAIPFARLRQENKPRKYAFIKLSGIVVNIALTVFFLVYMPRINAAHPNGWLATFAKNNNRVGLLIMANLLQNIFVFLMLAGEWKHFRPKINTALWKQIFAYSAPMIVIGLAGMVNEVMDRQMLAHFLPLTDAESKRLVGVYSANYKLAIFITLFIQAFKMAAEPFFFNQAADRNAPQLYARVMKWFVITLCVAFLFSALYLDVWQYFIGSNYRWARGIVPVLLLANVCLGIYYNLSVWYKITDRMRMGLYITLFGALITLVGNYFFIPAWGIYASAWTTLVCYAGMTVATYFVGRKYFPVPYPVKKILSYLTMVLLLFALKCGIDWLTKGMASTGLQIGIRFTAASGLMLLFVLLVVKVEKSELQKMPVIGKYVR
ncbi:MAG: polysaccharide biosynthesis C-terminal domain-containing protein [Edaphocola sp.]